MAIADLNFPPHFLDAQDSLTLTTFDSSLRVSWLMYVVATQLASLGHIDVQYA